MTGEKSIREALQPDKKNFNEKQNVSIGFNDYLSKLIGLLFGK